MATRHQFDVVISELSSTDLSAKQYYFAELTAGKVSVCNAVTDKPIGVIQAGPDAADRATELCVLGFTKVVAGAAISAKNTLIGIDSSGRAVEVTPGSDTTVYIVGTALTVSTGAGDIIEAIINCANPARAA
jgi:hypothetical protein